jgi:hypothetical protein
MLVYFSANARNISNDIKTYREIVACVQRYGGIMVYNWIESAAHRGALPVNNTEWWESMPSDARAGINDADVLIAETSGQSSLGVGIEVSQALRLGKPVLALVVEGEKGSSYIRGVNDKLLSVAYYNAQTLPIMINDFLVKFSRN